MNASSKEPKARIDPILAARAVYEEYRQVASGETRGAGGCFYADGHGTLSAVQINVITLERLALALGEPVLGRTHNDRCGKKGEDKTG